MTSLGYHSESLRISVVSHWQRSPEDRPAHYDFNISTGPNFPPPAPFST